MRSLLRKIPILLIAGALSGAAISGCAGTSEFEGMTISEAFEAGMRRFEQEDWDAAIEAYEGVIFAAPSSEQAPLARWHLAESYYQKEEYVTAASQFTRFIERYPTHELAPEAALGVCRSIVELSPIVQRDQTDTRRAHTSCSAAASDYPDTEAGQRAAELADRMWAKLAEKLFLSGEFYFDRDLYDSAILYYEDVVENYPNTEAAPKALRRMYEAYQEIGYAEEAEETRARLLEEYPDSDAARALEGQTSNGP